MMVFIISGLWHGAQWTFVLWGILHGLFCVFDRIIDKKGIEIFEPFRWLMTMIIVGALWLLFDAGSISQWLDMLVSAARMDNTSISREFVNALDTPESLFIYNLLHLKGLYYNIYCFGMYVMIGGASFICFVSENNNKRKPSFSPLSMISTGLLFSLGVLCVGGVSDFVYNGF